MVGSQDAPYKGGSLRMFDIGYSQLFIRDNFWLIWGFVSQALYAARFVVQWIASEIRKVSYVPKAFWHLSIFGSLGLLIYSIHREDPVFILGQSLSLIIYVRNLVLIRHSDRRSQRVV